MPTDYLDHLEARGAKLILVLDDSEVALISDALSAFARVVTPDVGEAHAAAALVSRLRSLRYDRELSRREHVI